MRAGTQPARRAKLLLILTSVCFWVWISAMLIMYFKTVYPQRYPATQAGAVPQTMNAGLK